MNFSTQIRMENELVQLIPLGENDFERLYEVASDPAIWENHPNRNRYKREFFKNFFEGALQSGGAYLVCNKSGKVIGGTRFYGYDASQNSILIGYTFYATQYWGKGYNHSVKKMMLDYIFQYVSSVFFHVGAENFRSQSAMKKLGAEKLRKISVAYHGEPEKLNFEYVIRCEDWQNERPNI